MIKLILLYGLLIGYLFLDVLILSPAEIPYYNSLLNPLILLAITGLAYYFSKDEQVRIAEKNNKFQSMLIVLFFYIIGYYALGFIFGFQRTPYSKDILSIISNIWIFGNVIFFQEIIRNAMIKMEKKSMLNFILITVLFIFLNINYNNLVDNFETFKDGFTYVSSVIIPLVVSNAVMTYLSYVGGAKFPIVYRLFVLLPELVMPIIPDLDWFVTAIVGVVLPMVVFIYINYVHVKKTERLSRRASKNYNPIVYIPVLILIALLAGFVIGLFKYQPIAVLSGSMSPTFNRGDAVVVRKLNKYEKQNLEKGDVIQYTSGSKYVVHRIVEITNDEFGNIQYITKGDHNNTRDTMPVSLDQIVGKVSFSIPFIGYPSVWLSGAI